MNSVPQSRVGVASGINNAVSRTAGLLAIAVFGILMLQSFNRTLDARLSGAVLSDAEHSALQSQRNKLAGAELPQEWNPRSRDFVRQAIDESFVNGFRVVMAVGAVLAIGSAISGWVLIRPKPRAESRFSQAVG
jgi:uncharacterized membrane protein YraQ (UPF0718 family)